MSSNGISPVQWHPFTAIPGEQAFSMVSIIKQYGKWTGQLMNRYDQASLNRSTVTGHLSTEVQRPSPGMVGQILGQCLVLFMSCCLW